MDNNSKEECIPDMGSGYAARTILSIALFVTVIVALSRNTGLEMSAVQDLLLFGGYILAIALTCIVLLKIGAPILRRMTPQASALFTAILFMISAIAVTEAMHFGLHFLGIIKNLWPDWHWPLLIRGLVVTGLCALVFNHYMKAHQKLQQESMTTHSAKLQALQSRIRPHFLFNSMNSIAGLLKSDPDRADRALQDLAEVFRVLLADARKLVPITVEMEISRQYLDIEKIRLGDRLDYKWSNSNVPRSALIPSLTLQPLLENAIYHGVEACFAGGVINIELWAEEEVLNILISNPLPEVTVKNKHRKGNQIALDNIRQRLAQHFGDKAELQSFEKTGTYFVKVSIPVLRG
ncbi:MAG TPA: hypothetical protein ENI80_01660 [Acidiferrobacteraceae bacterium]|nr:hypothetical protein [Acidiferrobacteraceae bacterium]